MAASTRRVLYGTALVVGVALVGYLGVRGLRSYYYRKIQPPALAQQPPLAELGIATAAACGVCHKTMYTEWQASMHGRAMSDPVFLSEWAQENRLFVCRRCHAPLVEQQPTLVTGLASLKPPLPVETANPAFVPALEQEGVTCTVCHQSGSELVGPLALTDMPHRTRIDPTFGADDLCRRCHALADSPGSHLVREPLATFTEHDEFLRAGNHERCVDCHFSPDERVLSPTTPPRKARSHSLRGARDADFIRSYIDIASTCAAATCTVTLHNRAGHRVPTGEPGRELRVAIENGEAQHILRRFDRIHLTENSGDDNTLTVGETRTVTLHGTGTVVVSFCLLEEHDPLVSDYESGCRELYRSK